ncbi:P-type DNA transfer ATPase VirB11 [Sphingorhabdus sp.]|uniref:P-type DNA transfer ATPase VirB11 n=1 Tax=Sphingorhabdus sp. TaxID=1902408 RepID=UPI0035944299
MNAPPQNIYLESYLAVLAPWLERSDLTDIYINRPGELWFEVLGSPPERCLVPELTGELLARMVKQIAAVTAQGINREHPLLSASLPDGTRVQAVIPPATRGEIALAFRKHVSVGLGLEDYRASGAVAETRIVKVDENIRGAVPVTDDVDVDVILMLRNAVRNKRNILVSGGTSSGKTAFVNALLREIPADERLILIEDTPELQIEHLNVVGLIAARSELGEAEVTAEDLLIAALRMRPDRIILGEIRGSEAVTFMRAVNTGHPGSITTIHADSPERAIDQLALLVMETGTRMGWDDVVRYVRNSLDIVVQLNRDYGKRDVGSVMCLNRNHSSLQQQS